MHTSFSVLTWYSKHRLPLLVCLFGQFCSCYLVQGCTKCYMTPQSLLYKWGSKGESCAAMHYMFGSTAASICSSRLYCHCLLASGVVHQAGFQACSSFIRQHVVELRLPMPFCSSSSQVPVCISSSAVVKLMLHSIAR